MSDFFDFERQENNVSDSASENITPVGNDVDSESIQIESGIEVEKTSLAYPVAKKIAAKEARLKELQALVAPSKDALKALKDEAAVVRKAMEDKLSEIAKQIHEIEVSVWDANKEIRSLRVEIDGLMRKLRVELDNELKKETFKSNVITFSKRLANYSYNENILAHQREGAYILATNGRAILGDKRGLGKTLTSLATLDALQVQKALVVVPDDVINTFMDEIRRWAPHRTLIQIGKLAAADRNFAFMMAKQLDQYIIAINYSAWRKDKSIIESIISLGVEAVIADEAHEMKNVSTSAYKGVRDIVLAENQCPTCGAIGSIRYVSTKDGWGGSQKCIAEGCTFDSHTSEYNRLDRCSVKYVYPMTGTVILNKPQDLFAQLSLVDPDNFETEGQFLRTYCIQDMYTKRWEFGPGGLESLQRKLSGKFLARDEKTAGVVRPKQSIEIHEIEMDPEIYPLQHKIITQLTKSAQVILDSGKKMSVLATIALITRQRQANVWPAGIQLRDDDGNVIFSVGDEVQESAKLDFILNDKESEPTGLLAELTEDGDMEFGANVVIFSQFKGPLMELERRCRKAGIKAVRFDGDTPEHIRSKVKLDFDRRYRDDENYEPQWQVVLANYRVGGVGLNFTAATEMIIVDEEWNPGKADQAFGRIDRIGQTEETNVHILRIPRTIDSWMVALNESKANMIGGFEKTAEGLSDSLLLAMRNGDII